MKSLLVTLLIICTINISYANKNKVVSEDYGNVKILFTSSHYYEEMNKSLIIGEYSEMLSKKLGYNSQITLWFKHSFSNNSISNYEVTHDRKNDSSKNNEIFIKMEDDIYDVCNVLSLLEYSILNVKSIGNWNGNEIIGNNNPPSKLLKNILGNKVYKPRKIEELDNLSQNAKYYFKNDKFHFFKINNGSEEIVLSLDNIFQLSDKGEYSYLLFDSVNSFYFVPVNRMKNVSKRIDINDTKNHYMPYKVRGISNQLSSITFSKLKSDERERVALYDEEKEVLIQNILKLIQ